MIAYSPTEVRTLLQANAMLVVALVSTCGQPESSQSAVPSHHVALGYA